jgi:hypothetical protein
MSKDHFPHSLKQPRWIDCLLFASFHETHSDQLIACLSSRTVDGTTFTSAIKEKTVGRALYSQARAKGKTAGLVR